MANELTPEHSEGFGPAENSDDTRQAQHSVSNDAPTDVNFNAIVARSQALTVDIAGKSFQAASDRRTIMADKGMA
jgi:hypothetical protein